MTDILYKGKRIDNGGWVCGYYAKAKDYLTEKEIHIIFPLNVTLYLHGEFDEFYEVIPESIERYFKESYDITVNIPKIPPLTNEDINKLLDGRRDHGIFAK